MRVEMVTISGILAPGPATPDRIPRQEHEYLAELSENALSVSESIEGELRHFLPPGCSVSAGITFRGSIEFELLIWIADFTSSIAVKMGAAKIVTEAIDPIIARTVNKVVWGTPLVPTRVQTVTRAWVGASTKSRATWPLAALGWFAAGIAVALLGSYLRRGG